MTAAQFSWGSGLGQPPIVHVAQPIAHVTAVAPYTPPTAGRDGLVGLAIGLVLLGMSLSSAVALNVWKAPAAQASASTPAPTTAAQTTVLDGATTTATAAAATTSATTTTTSPQIAATQQPAETWTATS